MTMPYRVALTGGIGSGKSTVASLFSKHGVPIIDTDLIARDIVDIGTSTLKEIKKHFGPVILNKKGGLDRTRMRQIIFEDDNARLKLEEILHPTIFREIDNIINTINYPYCLIVIPLLVETDQKDRFDRILVVDVPENIQIERATERDKVSPELISTIINKQANRDVRLSYADDTIDNSVEFEELERIVKNLHSKYLDFAKQNNINNQ